MKTHKLNNFIFKIDPEWVLATLFLVIIIKINMQKKTAQSTFKVLIYNIYLHIINIFFTSYNHQYYRKMSITNHSYSWAPREGPILAKASRVR